MTWQWNVRVLTFTIDFWSFSGKGTTWLFHRKRRWRLSSPMTGRREGHRFDLDYFSVRWFTRFGGSVGFGLGWWFRRDSGEMGAPNSFVVGDYFEGKDGGGRRFWSFAGGWVGVQISVCMCFPAGYCRNRSWGIKFDNFSVSFGWFPATFPLEKLEKYQFLSFPIQILILFSALFFFCFTTDILSTVYVRYCFFMRAYCYREK